MAYEKTLWKDRVVEKPNTYRSVENPDGTITLYPITGQVIEKGTPVSAANLNKIENGIVELGEQLDKKASKDDVAKISSGTPLFASSTIEMTDTTRNYVNTTDGYLYIYSNNKFINSNIKYQSTGISDDYIDVNMFNKYVRNYIGMDKLIDFQIGNISSEGGMLTSVEYNNVVSKEIINGYNTRVNIKNPNIARVKITYYDDEGRFLRNGSWTSEEVIIDDNCNIRIGICLYELLGNNTFKYTVEEMLNMVTITDTTSLKNEINDLSNFVKEISSGKDIIDLGKFELGTINGGNGTNNDSLTTRIRTISPLRISQKGKAYFSINDKYEVATTLYNLDTNEFISQTPWQKEYYIKETSENIGYRFAIRRVDQLDLSNIINEVINDFEVIVYNDKKLNIPKGSIGEYELSDDVKLKLNKNYDNFTTNNYIHISFDDVSTCITDIINNKYLYSTIFDNIFLNFLKQLHENYGAVFSLYLYNINQLSNFPDKFKEDFIKNNKWLKFGLHANNSSTNYTNATAQQGKNDWDLFIEQMYRIGGGYGSIDRIPRLHTFAGSKECLTAMRDCYCGALGFLSSDDSRDTYYLNSTQKEYLRTHDKLEDIENGLIFFSTDLRLDWFNSNFSTTNQYNKPVKDTPYEELVYRYGQPTTGDCYHSLITFTHEWEIYDGFILNSKKSRVEDICKFGVDYGYSFDFPQNRTNGGITSLKLAFDTIKSLVVE